MTREISRRELRNDSGAILRAVEAGEDFVVLRNGTAVAELRPLQRRRFVAKAQLLTAARQLATVDAATFCAEADDFIGQSLEREL